MIFCQGNVGLSYIYPMKVFLKIAWDKAFTASSCFSIGALGFSAWDSFSLGYEAGCCQVGRGGRETSWLALPSKTRRTCLDI